MKSHREGWLSYVAALAIGIALVLSTFPHWALVGGLPPGAPPKPDFGKDIIGQLYYFAQEWRFGNLPDGLIDQKLDAPWGASIALTDSIPLCAVIAKLLRPVLPPFDQAITLYQSLAWVMQSAAAVFALRGAGERRLLPAIAIAVMASSMPTFLFRLWHAALSGHFFLLLMLGLYFRAVKGNRTSLPIACCLQNALLLVHPYLMLMATVLLFAAPLTQMMRRDTVWRRNAAACVISTMIMLLIGQGLGYWGAQSDGGFGYYSMNLLGPFWPTFSTLFPGIRFAPADGTGGQAEGYQYLGFGLLLLLALSISGWRIWRVAIRQNQGLAIAAFGLTALAVTNWVYFLHFRLMHVPFPSLLLSQVRASGRLFWPVAYMALVGSVFVTCRRFPGRGEAIVAIAAMVQFMDAQQLRRIDHDQLMMPAAYPFDAARLSAVLRHYKRLTLLPTFPCNGGGTPSNEDVVWLASGNLMSVNSVYGARETHPQACFPAQAMNSRTEDDEIRVILPGFLQSAMLIPNSDDDCRLFGSYILCTRNADFLNDLPAYAIKSLPTAVPLPMVPGSPGADSLLAGWEKPELTGGVWSLASTTLLGGRLSPLPSGNVEVRITAAAMPLGGVFGISSPRRPVAVWAAGRHIGDWIIGPRPSQYDVTIPAGLIDRQGLAVLELRTTGLRSALDLGLRSDPRRFGILLKSVSFTPSPGSARTASPDPAAAQ